VGQETLDLKTIMRMKTLLLSRMHEDATLKKNVVQSNPLVLQNHMKIDLLYRRILK
jgi:hypothetical protein